MLRPTRRTDPSTPDYVSTRWYRAPELLVGDTVRTQPRPYPYSIPPSDPLAARCCQSYGEAVDIWAIGCMLAEMSTGVPLFPGDSDIDQLFLIMRCCGSLTERQRAIFHRNPLYVNVKVRAAHMLAQRRDWSPPSQCTHATLPLPLPSLAATGSGRKRAAAPAVSISGPVGAGLPAGLPRPRLRRACVGGLPGMSTACGGQTLTLPSLHDPQRPAPLALSCCSTRTLTASPTGSSPSCSNAWRESGRSLSCCLAR